MSEKILKRLFLITASCLLQVRSEIYQDRPKIRTSDGDLILEPALDKNIYLRPNGPKSSIYIGNVDVLKNLTETNQLHNNERFDWNIDARNEILERIDRLENEHTVDSNATRSISIIRRSIRQISIDSLRLMHQVDDILRHYCDSNPCQHGGTCLYVVNGYHCLCPSNWEGKNCDEDVNECRNFAGTDLGCQNGATCQNRPGTYECLCKSNWRGVHCTTQEKDCSAGDYEMCGHGTCVNVQSGIKCICHQGWTSNATGAACLTDINECDHSKGFRCSVNPRVECINLPGSFRCGQCPAGYEGDGYVCYDIDECLTVTNGGCSPLVTCHNTIGSRICGLCPTGYQGDGVTCTYKGSCNIDRGGCHPSAHCIENVTPTGQTALCICPEGMDGDGVGLTGCYVSTSNSTDVCENNPCGNHGRCHPLRSGYTCICYKGYRGSHCEITNACATKPCQNGGVCKRDESTQSGFRCECTAQYTGYLCQVRTTTCGGMLSAEEGSIAFPLSNTTITYSHNAQCAWVIHTTPDKVINVTFSKFNVERTPGCSGDFLQIHDGPKSASQLIGRFCGNTAPKGGNIVSSHNYLYLWFHSDKTIAAAGFALHWTSVNPVCGGEIDGTSHGHISSPGSPGQYPPNRDCYWHLTTTLGKRINLHFFALDIESHTNCSFDYLAIYDGASEADPLISKYCNSSQPAPVVSAGSDMFIHFHSDAYGTGNGFQIVYAPAEGVPGCGGYFTANKGEIASPTSHDEIFSTIYLICEYKVKTSIDTKIKLNFKTFNLLKSGRCRFESLEIYDGPSTDSPLIGKFCNVPSPLTSSSNVLFFKYKSIISGTAERFRIAYDAVCDHILVGDSGVVKSPKYPFSYPANLNCTFVIKTEPGKNIQLAFQDFDVEDNSRSDCLHDYVEIRDGPDIRSKLLGRYCGSSRIPPVSVSTHNYLYLTFVTDMSISGTGFYANYTTLETVCGGINTERTGLINHPDGDGNYRNRQSCQWLIVAPAGMRIKLTWNRFALEDQRDCSADFLEIIELEDDNTKEVLGKYCGTRPPPALTTFTNRLELRFVSDVILAFGGFSATYTFINETLNCGGEYLKSHGYIYSPNWPRQYPPSRDCIWTITVPVGQQISLNISNFDLERPIRDKCDFGDYLEIRNGGILHSTPIGKYCGSFKYKRIISLSNSLYLRFHSDIYLTGTGFKVEWDSAITGCGGTLTSSSGSILSPNYPEKYHDNAECFYKIVTNAGSRIQISFTDLLLERTDDCTDDYVQIYDGNGPESPSLGRFCFLTEKTSKIITTTNYAFIKFRSDIIRNEKGFMLNYNAICNNNITGHYGVIESPDFPNNDPSNIHCLWNINALKGHRINATFTHFSIPNRPTYLFLRRRGFRNYNYYEDTTRCRSDFLQVKGASDPSFSKQICGLVLPKPITSKSNSLQIEFQAGSPTAEFRLEWVSYGCGGHIRKQSGTVSFDRTVSHKDEIECEWLIETDRGQEINIIFTDVDMTDSPNCNIDAIEIYNGRDTTAPILSKLCHRNVAQMESDSNFMLFKTDRIGTAKGFKAEFGVTCGAFITDKQEGIIENERLINNLNRSCLWTIVAPSTDQKISLTLTHMSLPKDTNIVTNRECPSTFLRVLDGDDKDSPLIGEYCGRKVPPMIVSRGNAITIELGSYTDRIGRIFAAHFSTTTNACGGRLTSEEGSVASPAYPSPYPANLDCEWILQASEGNKAFIMFEKFDLENSEACNEDYLEIREANAGGKLLGVYCGNELPTNNTIAAEIFIKFRSTAQTSGQGFLLHYGYLHENEIQGDNGEIASPLYPIAYDGAGEYTWRILSFGTKIISITINNLEIPSYGDETYNRLTIYDGYDNTAPILEQLYGVIETQKTIQASASALYIKLTLDESNTGSRFHLSWTTASDDVSSLGDKINCGFNQTNLVLPSQIFNITTPNYPTPYKGNLNCEWIYRAPVGRHLSLSFADFDIEEAIGCRIASVSIYSAESPGDWKPVKKNICTTSESREEFITSTYLKVVFKTDLYAETHKKGFFGNIESKCGGLIKESSGEVGPLWIDGLSTSSRDTVKCDWTIKVRPGRTISLRFTHFNITNPNNLCIHSVVLRNGESKEAPFLGSGKYCGYEHEKTTDLATSSNSLFVSYTTTRQRLIEKDFLSFKIYYEENHVDCGTTSLLTADHSWEIITTPNYPSQPIPYTECEWSFTGPPGEIIRIDFIDRFDVADTDDCATEAVEIRSGLSGLSPGQSYCGEKPGTIKSTSNTLYVKYLTLLSEPKGGFKANVSIDVCGGTIIASTGELSSPGYPNMLLLKGITSCEWHVIGPTDHIFLIKPQNIRLPSSQEYCVKLSVGKPKWDQVSENAGFLFNFNSSIPTCSGFISASEGYINTPSYPQDTKLTHCHWRIEVPDKSRRIRLEILDSDQEKHKIYHSNIKRNTKIQILAEGVSNECGGRLSNYRKMFSSPNYPKTYSPNQECAWEIDAGLGFRVSLKFTGRISIEQSPNCTKDAVIIYDWKNNDYVEMGRVCGRHLPPSYNSTNSKLKVVFRTDAQTNLDGFQAIWDHICGGQFIAVEEEQILYSPGYLFSTQYNIECTYDIRTASNNNNEIRKESNNKKVVLKFLEFELSGEFPNCEDEKLTITTMGNFYQDVSQDFCGKKSPSVVKSMGPVKMVFKTYGVRPNRGFKLFYSIFTCGAKVNDSTVINIETAQNDVYGNSLNCLWTIEGPPNKIAVVKFFFIHLEQTYDCYGDHISVFDGLAANDSSKRLALLCGFINSNTILRSTGNTMLLQLELNSGPQLRGFKAFVYFVDSKASGCGRQIDLIANSAYRLKYPQTGVVYENFLDCHWSITSPLDTVISVTFQSFHISPCVNINQTALGYSKCDCDFVELKDGLYPNSLVIGVYCGHSFPPRLTSSGNSLSLRLSTDGEEASSGFEAMFTVRPNRCGQTVIHVDRTPQRVVTPGYDRGSIPRGLHCKYHLVNDGGYPIQIHILNLNLRPPVVESGNINRCNKDTLVITSNPTHSNDTIGKDLVINSQSNFDTLYFFESTLNPPSRIELCGDRKGFNLNLYGGVTLNLITSADSDSKAYKGVEIVTETAGLCSKNYTEPQGRLYNSYGGEDNSSRECFTLITAPENYTISAYFISTNPNFWDRSSYLEIFDGNATTSKRLMKSSSLSASISENAVFSTGRYMLLHSDYSSSPLMYDMNYVITDKGVGCGGKLHNIIGTVTSPMYPETYRKINVCEWELETPTGTNLMLKFTNFDLGTICDQNYVQLVDRKGEVVRTYCLESPAEYSSPDNYVKIVFKTTLNNAGSGWIAIFASTAV
ncbi:cubilin homolog [Anticarsia gemmatalis]|uniref:cubilin homolog n=1 Tax=Anticarsia gemmatalis TaxID=129554 RepID=UPI003F769119